LPTDPLRPGRLLLPPDEPDCGRARGLSRSCHSPAERARCDLTVARLKAWGQVILYFLEDRDKHGKRYRRFGGYVDPTDRHYTNYTDFLAGDAVANPLPSENKPFKAYVLRARVYDICTKNRNGKYGIPVEKEGGGRYEDFVTLEWEGNKADVGKDNYANQR